MSEAPKQIRVTVTHTLPGRLRLCLSHPPQKADKTEHMVMSHPGVMSVVYNGPTMNLLILYDPGKIAVEEIILRVALCLSVDYRLKPIFIKTSDINTPLGTMSILSGLSLLVAHTLSIFSVKPNPLSALHIICGLATTVAVSEHIFLDLKDKGRFHPEVLSIGYLLSSFLRGKVLKGATTAWIMTFARHLLEPPAKVLKLEAAASDPSCDAHRCEYEAKISRKLTTQGGTLGVLSHLPNLLLGMYTDMQLTAEDRIFKEIQKLSVEHNDVLEGLEHLQRGIRLQVES
jgi:hypothetical protein